MVNSPGRGATVDKVRDPVRVELAEQCRQLLLHPDATVRNSASEILRLVLAALASPTWVPVAERLPADGQSVAFVVSCKDPTFYLNGSVLGGTFRAGPYAGFGVPGMTVSASHWMPLPAPPTGE
jgi:hypothetical protein